MPASPFTQLLLALSTRLAGAAGERLGEEARAALEAVRTHFGADQCAILRSVPPTRSVVMVHRVTAEGVPPVPTNFDYGRAFPAIYEATFGRGENFILDDLEGLEGRHPADLESARRIGVAAVIALAIRVGGEVRYSLALGRTRPHAWPRDRVAQLLAFGEIIAGALERETHEQEVRRREADLVEAQRVAHMGSWVRDFVADHFSASEEAFRILGARVTSAAEWLALVHPDDRARLAAEIEAVRAAGGRSFRFEYRIVRPGGAVRTIVVRGEVRYHADGHPSTAIGTIRDVTEGRRTRRELAALRERIWHADRAARAGALGSSLGHELGQPLTAILANAQAGMRLLESGRADAGEMASIQEAVVRDTRRAIAIIDGLRAMLRKDTAVRSPVDVSEAASEVLALLRGELEGRGIELHRALGAECTAWAVRAQLQQVFMNLLTNAIAAVAARPAGERHIEVAVARDAGGIEVRIEDSGPGIPEAERAAVFEPFHTTRATGLGMGLAITRSIVEAHEGRVALESGARGGASFRVRLPAMGEAETASAILAAAQPPPPRPAAPRPEAALVCVVDDDASVREGLTRLLMAAGHGAAAFASGEALLASGEARRADCVLLDLRMGARSGLEVQARLAELHPAPPVVFLTGHGDVPAGVRAMRRGAVDFLLKPVDDGTLLASVARAIEAGREARAARRALEGAQARLAALTPREREIGERVVRGRLNKQIAADLGIAETTVKQHRGRLMEKAGVGSVAELVRLWEAAGAGAAP